MRHIRQTDCMCAKNEYDIVTKKQWMKVIRNSGRSDFMKVLLMNKPGDVTVTEIPTPKPKEDEVLIRVMAAGICTNDIRDYQGDCNYSYPRIGGHEYSGVIEELE